MKRFSLRDVFWVLVGAMAIVGFWRGVWNLLDKYLIPSHFVLSQLISIVGGIFILILISRYR